MAHVGAPALYPIKREEEEEEIIRQPCWFTKKKSLPLFQCQMCVGLSLQQAILQHYRGVLQFNLILTLCIFLNVLSGPTV